MRKSILFIIPGLNIGGAELLMVKQVQWFQANNWETVVVILSTKNDQGLTMDLKLGPDKLLVLNSSYSVLNNAAIGFAIKNRNKLKDFAKKHEVGNIVAHLPLAHFWGRLLKLKFPSAQLLVYHHSMQYQASPLDTWSKKLFNQLQKWLAAKTDDVSVCISESVKQNIQQNFILKNPVVLYNAVSDSGYTEMEAGERKEFDDDKPVIKIIIPGRLHPAKGHLFFLKVFHEFILESDKPVVLVIAGGGSLEAEINEFIKKNKLEYLASVTGFLSNKLLLGEMKKANLVLIPSISEGLGIVAIEALMLGKTVIASDAGGLKEVFTHGKNGYLFEAGNHDACLNILRIVLSNMPSTLFSPTSLREDYKDRFSFDTYIQKFTALLKQPE